MATPFQKPDAKLPADIEERQKLIFDILPADYMTKHHMVEEVRFTPYYKFVDQAEEYHRNARRKPWEKFDMLDVANDFKLILDLLIKEEKTALDCKWPTNKSLETVDNFTRIMREEFAPRYKRLRAMYLSATHVLYDFTSFDKNAIDPEITKYIDTQHTGERRDRMYEEWTKVNAKGKGRARGSDDENDDDFQPKKLKATPKNTKNARTKRNTSVGDITEVSNCL